MRWQWSTLDEMTPRALYAAMALRQEVFVVEQNCVYLDADGGDLRAHHLLGWHGERLVAYARVFGPREGRPIVIGRVVTSPRVRGTGLGRPLMRQAMERAWQAYGPGQIHISAQAHLADYYGSLGFVVSGEGYDEDGIPHLPMDWRASS
ncbi:MAG: GNAT family N-acetyltransferase [Myxococcota bacterium]